MKGAESEEKRRRKTLQVLRILNCPLVWAWFTYLIIFF